MENGGAANAGASAKRRRRRGVNTQATSGPGVGVAVRPQAEALPVHSVAPPRGMLPVVASRFMSSTTAEHLTSTRFNDLEGISPLTKRCTAWKAC